MAPATTLQLPPLLMTGHVEVVQPLVAPKDRLVDAMQVEGEVVLGLYLENIQVSRWIPFTSDKWSYTPAKLNTAPAKLPSQ